MTEVPEPKMQVSSSSFFQLTCLDSDQIAQCICYIFICPILVILGVVGCIANIFLMSGRGFKGVTFYYLRALSISDLFYLLTVSGNIVEILFLEIPEGPDQQEQFLTMFYLTHMDHILCNTFINTSGFLIILLTIDRYSCTVPGVAARPSCT